MLPSVLMKLLSQHRVLYCYLILSIWIFLMVGGMYKYIGTEDVAQGFKHSMNDILVRGFPKDLKPDIKTRRIFRLCNPPEDIALGNEGQVDGNYTLTGVIVFLRHGDRGPLMHVRNISNVNCAGDLLSPDITNGDWDAGYAAYEAFLQNASLAAGLGGGMGGGDKLSSSFLWQLLGPFHAFPLVPPSNGECSLGQLTPVGVTQLLRTGQILRSVYGEKLGIGKNTISTDDVVVYSTHYRRTFQSALAFLYTFLSMDDLHKVTLRPSQSLAFCFNDCACPAAEKYRRQFSSESSSHFRSHPAVMKLVRSAASIVYESPDKTLLSDPHALRDALLAYVCHGAQLPCKDVGMQNKEVCVRPEQVTGLFAYTEWEERLYVKSHSLKRSCLLRAYGLLRNVVSYLLRMVSEKRPRIVIYSGHDKTLQYLTGALGVIAETAAPHYASRLVIEVYRSGNTKNSPTDGPPHHNDEGPAAKDFFFRLVFNGRDVTNHIVCCRHGGSTLANPVGAHGADSENSDHKLSGSSSGHRKVNSSYLCPIESIVRFLHDDYFVPFNASNFKDACTNHL